MSNIFQVAYAYVDACCFSLSAEKFEQILHREVKLSHQTNDDKPVRDQGKARVAALFKKHVFENTSNIVVHSFSLTEKNMNIVLQLNVEETKNESGMINRYVFKETTIFQLEEEDDQFKITSIDMKVQKQPIYSRL